MEFALLAWNIWSTRNQAPSINKSTLVPWLLSTQAWAWCTPFSSPQWPIPTYSLLTQGAAHFQWGVKSSRSTLPLTEHLIGLRLVLLKGIFLVVSRVILLLTSTRSKWWKALHSFMLSDGSFTRIPQRWFLWWLSCTHPEDSKGCGGPLSCGSLCTACKGITQRFSAFFCLLYSLLVYCIAHKLASFGISVVGTSEWYPPLSDTLFPASVAGFPF